MTHVNVLRFLRQGHVLLLRHYIFLRDHILDSNHLIVEEYTSEESV